VTNINLVCVLLQAYSESVFINVRHLCLVHTFLRICPNMCFSNKWEGPRPIQCCETIMNTLRNVRPPFRQTGQHGSPGLHFGRPLGRFWVALGAARVHRRYSFGGQVFIRNRSTPTYLEAAVSSHCQKTTSLDTGLR
jgi:hypothetical protein